jgi:hypothetical protein
MSEVIKRDRTYPRPAETKVEKKGLRGGGPTMSVPGSGGVRAQPLNPTQADQSVSHHADAMSGVGGPAEPARGRPDQKRE